MLMGVSCLGQELFSIFVSCDIGFETHYLIIVNLTNRKLNKLKLLGEQF